MDNQLLKAVNMAHQSGRHTRAQFIKACGVDPVSYPRYFTVNQHGLVIVKTIYRAELDYHFNKGQRWGVTAIAC